jgi:hypothetical protein
LQVVAESTEKYQKVVGNFRKFEKHNLGKLEK